VGEPARQCRAAHTTLYLPRYEKYDAVQKESKSKGGDPFQEELAEVEEEVIKLTEVGRPTRKTIRKFQILTHAP
jgi:hypothetical protein